MPDGAREFNFDAVVVGAGPAGLAAAAMAAECGRRVALVEGTPWLGGQIWRGEESHLTTTAAPPWLDRLQQSGAHVFRATTVFAAPQAKVLLAEQLASHEPARRPRGFGVRQPSAAFGRARPETERHRTAALQDAVACQLAPPRFTATGHGRRAKGTSPEPFRVVVGRDRWARRPDGPAVRPCCAWPRRCLTADGARPRNWQCTSHGPTTR